MLSYTTKLVEVRNVVERLILDYIESDSITIHNEASFYKTIIITGTINRDIKISLETAIKNNMLFGSIEGAWNKL